MKRIQGKVLAIVASVLSTLFSVILFVIALIVKLFVDDSDFQSTTRDGLLLNNPNLSADEIAEFSAYSPFTIVMNLFLIGSIIFLILSLTALVLSIKANYKNKVLVGASLIGIGMVHLVFSRLLSGILLLVAGFLILSDREPGSDSTRKIRIPEQFLNREHDPLDDITTRNDTYLHVPSDDLTNGVKNEQDVTNDDTDL